ncbi:MAG: LytR/AlgR family response regulator transcription factor [Flavobacteriales bacterium]
MKIKSVIVDDEAIAREVLKKYLIKYCPQIELLGEAENIHDAVPLILDQKPQLVFLDVEMPYGNAFDILEATKSHTFETIFITAFSEYSLQALNMSATYYILKPIDIQELVTAIDKVQKIIQNQPYSNRNQVLLENLKQSPEKQQIILPTQQGFDVMKLRDIMYIQADGNFTQIYAANGDKKMVCRFLKYFEELLSHPFIRIHRSHIINIHYLKSYHKGKGGYVVMENGAEIEVSVSYKERLLNCF